MNLRGQSITKNNLSCKFSILIDKEKVYEGHIGDTLINNVQLQIAQQEPEVK